MMEGPLSTSLQHGQKNTSCLRSLHFVLNLFVFPPVQVPFPWSLIFLKNIMSLQINDGESHDITFSGLRAFYSIDWLIFLLGWPALAEGELLPSQLIIFPFCPLLPPSPVEIIKCPAFISMFLYADRAEEMLSLALCNSQREGKAYVWYVFSECQEFSSLISISHTRLCWNETIIFLWEENKDIHNNWMP